ncbi:MAG: DeoR family transcriptional regulator [Candidatus Wildermuthbacteria bacterium]|nr:DeoR family transcriptional regulator [Candidatus Wildermuthbacteria bacterium]
MDKDFLIKVTLAVYKVCHALPDEEPLKISVQTTANDILCALVLLLHREYVRGPIEHLISHSLQQLGLLSHYFSQIQTRNWIDRKNFLILQYEYAKIRTFVEQLAEVSQQKNEVKSQRKEDITLPLRQRKILEILRNKEKIQVQEIQKIMPEVTKRTLRRDLDALLHLDLIERLGEWNAVSYKLKVK